MMDFEHMDELLQELDNTDPVATCDAQDRMNNPTVRVSPEYVNGRRVDGLVCDDSWPFGDDDDE